MAMISRFEDINAWQEARVLVKMIYKLTDQGLLPGIMVFEIKSSEHLSRR